MYSVDGSVWHNYDVCDIINHSNASVSMSSKGHSEQE